MPRAPVIERYFAQCQAHRSPPLPIFVASLRDGLLEVNLADVSLADIRLFALAVLDTTSVTATGGHRPAATAASRGVRGSGLSDVSSATSAHGAAATFFSKLHLGYAPCSAASRRQLSGGPRSGATAASAAPPSLLAPQAETTLRRLIEAVTQLVKENASTLRSFAWCGLPIVPPGHGPHAGAGAGGAALVARVNSLALTQLLPLCRHLTCLRMDGVALSRAQFMQLTMISLSGSSTDVGGGSWLALEEASFVGCDLTDSCKGGIVRLIRTGVPMKSVEQWRRSLRSSTGGGSSSGEPTPTSSPPTAMSGAVARTRGLRRLDLSGNPLSDETARAIAAAISGAALHTLSLANTAITSKGAALLLLPAVLEDNAVELMDLSNTQVSKAYGSAAATSTSSSAELRLLAASSIAVGFRVVARGMGQLLVLREAVRTPHQPWNVRTSVPSNAVAQAAVAAAAAASTAGESPVLAPPRDTATRTPSSARGSGRSRQRSRERKGSPTVQGRRDDADAPSLIESDPFSAFIPTTTPDHLRPQQRPTRTGSFSSSVAAHPSTAPRTDTPSTAAPPQCPSTTTAAAGMAGPPPASLWWPPWAMWGQPPPSQQQQQQGKEWVPVPVPVPFPVYTPMQLPYAAPPLLAGASPGAAALCASPLPSAAAAATTRATADEENPSVAPPTATAKATAAVPPFPPAAPPSLPPPPPTDAAPREEAPERHEQAVRDDEVGAAPAMGGGGGTLVPATAATTNADEGDASSQLTRTASEAAGGSKFLTALIARLEAHETDVSERLEQQHQRTTTQLTALEKDMRFRLQQLTEARRKESAAAADRQTALLDAIAGIRDAPAPSPAEAMSEEMLAQLVRLIEAGMSRVQAALTKDGVTDERDVKGAGVNGLASRESPKSAVVTERDMVKETNQRLKQLGW